MRLVTSVKSSYVNTAVATGQVSRRAEWPMKVNMQTKYDSDRRGKRSVRGKKRKKKLNIEVEIYEDM